MFNSIKSRENGYATVAENRFYFPIRNYFLVRDFVKMKFAQKNARKNLPLCNA